MHILCYLFYFYMSGVYNSVCYLHNNELQNIKGYSIACLSAMHKCGISKMVNFIPRGQDGEDH